MADKFLNLTAVQTVKDWAKGLFAKDADLDTLSDRVDEIIAEGGEPNVIESVKVNDTALTPDANKAVNVEVPEVSVNVDTDIADITDTDGNNLRISRALENIAIKFGNGTPAVLASTDYVDENGGKIDKIKVNGTEQPITNKTANLTVPTKTSDLTNDDDFQTAEEVEQAIADAVVGALKPKGSCAFADLPPLTAANLNTMYDITDAFTTTADFMEGAGHRHPAGTNVAIINVGTDANPVYKYDVMPGPVDLSAYWTSTTGEANTLEAATVAEINAILNA